jgi:hypothetical protein
VVSPGTRTRLSALAIAVVALGCTLKDPIMVLPPRLLADADVMHVHGLQGFVAPWTGIRFGGFHTTKMWRGWAESSSGWSWAILDDDQTTDGKQRIAFDLEGVAGERWSVHCLSRSHEHHLDAAVGFHIGTDGSGIDRERVESVSTKAYECDLESGARAHWRLSLSNADPSGMGGVLLDERQATRAHVAMVLEQTGRPYTYEIPQPVGFLVETTGGAAVGVERAFEGKVVMGHAVPAAETGVLAAVATALLVWEPL